MKKRFLSCIILILFCSIAMFSCEMEYRVVLPTLKEADGWIQTLNDEFSDDEFQSMQDIYEKTAWRPSPHGLRKYEYWCDQMIEYDSKEGAIVIHSEQRENHRCSICNQANGIFTSGIETRQYNTAGESIPTFEQAFGYFEARVKVPRGEGMWSAFWLQANSVGRVGDRGEDGTEIDIYESSFMKQNPTKTGNALHYDAYEAPYYKMDDKVSDIGYNLYDGEYHTYALLWTPEHYVFYVDGKSVWKTSFGGVSKIAEFLRLTVEIRDTTYGPYSQKIGTFKNSKEGANDFYINKIQVWQNKEFEEKIRILESFD